MAAAVEVLALRAGVTPHEAVVEVAPAMGGALTRFGVADRDVLRPTPATALAERNVRLCAGYPLVPFSNRIAHARLTWQGVTHALARNFGDHPHAIHGVGWQRPWRVEAHTTNAVTLAYTHLPIAADAAAWPFAFEARQHIALACEAGVAQLTLTLSIASRDDRSFPFGLGWHPFFPRHADTMVRWDAQGLWRNDATELPVEHVPVPAAWQHAVARAPLAGLDNLFTQWAGHATLRSATQGVGVDIAADRACANLVVYVPEGRTFMAIEPVTHMTDAFNRAARGDADTGTRTLRPGAAFSCTMRLIATPLR